MLLMTSRLVGVGSVLCLEVLRAVVVFGSLDRLVFCEDRIVNDIACCRASRDVPVTAGGLVMRR
jgi:hypothetical protein